MLDVDGWDASPEQSDKLHGLSVVVSSAPVGSMIIPTSTSNSLSILPIFSILHGNKVTQ